MKNKANIFYQTMMFFNEVLFTSYCCVSLFIKEKNNTLYLPWNSPWSFLYTKGVYSVNLSEEVPY